jgi:hypothetical protein
LSIGRPTLDARRYSFSRSSPKPTDGGVDDDRHVELGRELKERQTIVIVGIMTRKTGQDPGASQPVLFDGALPFAQERVVAVGHGRADAVDGRILILQRGNIAVHLFDRIEHLIAVHMAQLVDRLADERGVDAGFLLRLENILDRHRATALPERRGLLFGCLHVGMEVEDHTGSLKTCASGRLIAATSIAPRCRRP